jgi:hypothetical protein
LLRKAELFYHRKNRNARRSFAADREKTASSAGSERIRKKLKKYKVEELTKKTTSATISLTETQDIVFDRWGEKK